MKKMRLGTTLKYQRKSAFSFIPVRNWDRKYPLKETQLLALGGEVSQIHAGPHDLRMSDAVALDKKPGNFQEEDEEEAGDVFFLRSELIGTNEEAANNSHHAAHEDEEAEGLQEKIEQRSSDPVSNSWANEKTGTCLLNSTK